MNPNDLRDGFLKFFAQRDHTICPSDRLIPENDPSLLFTPAGMNQFKDMFMGVGTLSFKRATTSQKCLRMPDLDNVGKTASHHTLFEMLGNFSFGDYFKEEAIAWSIEYLVDELGIPFKDLAFSIYDDDDEAAQIWQKKMNVPSDRFYRFGEKSNFWPAEAPTKGPNGVCGPCSEIFVDLGGGCGRPECDPDCDCGRFVEVWNLVFTQFLRKDGGVLEPLPRKNIDTGMGFERLLRVLEGADTNFDTTLFKPIIQKISSLSGKEYGAIHAHDVRIRRIADHIRAAVFCVSEGIAPTNEKQGYVVRKILRRAMLDGSRLGIEGSFLEMLVQPVVAVMGTPYPELIELQKRIEREIKKEEDKFSATFVQGLGRLEGLVKDLDKKGKKTLSGKSAFLLYDTFGFPLDITIRYLEDVGGSVDIEGFNEEMDAQRARARAGSNIATEIFDTGPLANLKGKVAPTEFIGYDSPESRCRIAAILTDEGLVDAVPQGTSASIILDRTPFYAEAGGQVGDRGVIECDTFSFLVNRNTVADGDFFLHSGLVTEGTVTVGDSAIAAVNVDRRQSIRRNHTATHLLHWALRKVLGDQVEQAGSLVEDRRLRFDFQHGRAMTSAEISTVLTLVSEKIRSNLPLKTLVLPIAEAKAMGAMALFGEKYGEEVRTVVIDADELEERSVELCGGTHVATTGEIGSFWIVSEESIAAGVRRIEAVTSSEAEQYLQGRMTLLTEASKVLKAPPDRLPDAIKDLQQQLKDLRKEISRHRERSALEQLSTIIESGRELGDGLKFFSGRVDGLSHIELKKLIDNIRGRSEAPFGIILLSKDGDRANFVAAIDKALIDRGAWGADEICKYLGGRMKGGGGGRPTMAQGQGSAPSNVDDIFKEALVEALQKISP